MGGTPFDWKKMLAGAIRDPHQLQAILDTMQKTFAAASQKK
jgi:hypothetical protein